MSLNQDSSRGNYAQLQQSLVAPEGVLPTTTATPMIEVTAPATLSEGYAFDVEINGKTISIQVPKGGVEEGQKFTIALPPEASVEYGLPRINVPVGQWRDSLCSCCDYGPCHHHVWTSLFCCLIAAGQVITRLQLTWTGQPSNNIAETTGAFWILFYIVVARWTVYFLTIFIVAHDPAQEPSTFQICVAVVYDLLFLSYLAWTMFVLRNIRQYVRSKYAIPENEACPTGCEDLCCAICCPQLTAAQLLRHTTDYDTYHSSCCTEMGVPDNVPSIV